MSIWRRVASLGIACALPLVAAQADETAATLEVNPATIAGRTVSDQEPVFFQVRLKAGSQELKDITLSAFSNDGIEAKVEPPDSATVAALPAKAEQFWKLKVTPAKPGVVAPGALSVNVSVAFKEGQGTPLQRYLFGTLSITAPGAITVPALAEIDFKGSLDALSHQRPGQLFVTVVNKYAQAVDVTDIKVSTPKFIIATPATTRLQIPYGETGVVAVTVKIADQIVPGKYPVVVVASLKTANGLTGTAVKSQDADIGVLGESDLLSKLGAPSMLFLPGVLFLLAWQLLWSIGKKTAAERQDYLLTPTTGGFWVIAVAIAFVVARAYPWITEVGCKLMRGYFGIARDATCPKRDYLVAYGFDDYAYLFALVIVSAVALYLAWRGLNWLRAWLNMPAARDRPVNIVRKLGRLNLTVQLPRAHPTAGGAGDIVYILDAWRESSLIWIVPPAVLTDGAQADDLSRNLMQDIVVGRIPEARRLAPLLQQGLDAGWWQFEWAPVAGIEFPRKVTATGWTELPQAGRVIRAG